MSRKIQLYDIFEFFIILSFVVVPSYQNLVEKSYLNKSDLVRFQTFAPLSVTPPSEENSVGPPPIAIRDNFLLHLYRASIPIRIIQCMENTNIMRCMKLFLLQRMEGEKQFTNSGNLTRDFFDQIMTDKKSLPVLFDKNYDKLNDTELTNRLVLSFRNFFKDRNLKLNFIPGIVVKVIPSSQDKVKFTIKKHRSGARRNKHYKYIMQIAVPMLMMPAILLGTFLPFLLPALKMATIMTTIINKGALLAAIMYAARTATLNNEAQIIHYTHPGYH